jgi:hypothetical protein
MTFIKTPQSLLRFFDMGKGDDRHVKKGHKQQPIEWKMRIISGDFVLEIETLSEEQFDPDTA